MRMFSLGIEPIAVWVIKFICRRMTFPASLTNMASNVFSIARNNIRTQGLIDTVHTLVRINQELQRRGQLNNIINTRNMNPLVFQAFEQVLSRNWGQCLAFADSINRYFYLYTFGTIVASSPILFFKITKFGVGIILGSMGIMLNETLSSIPYLKSFAFSVLDFVQNHSNFVFFKNTIKSGQEIVENIKPILPSKDKDEYIPKSNINPYALLTLVVCGIVIFSCSLVAVDYTFPNVIHNVPVLGKYTEFIQSTMDSFTSWVNSFFSSNNNNTNAQLPQVQPQPQPQIHQNSNIVAEAISRSSSGDSVRTIVPGDIVSPTPILKNKIYFIFYYS